MNKGIIDSVVVPISRPLIVLGDFFALAIEEFIKTPNMWLIKQHIIREHDIEDFKKSLYSKIEAIPEENRTEPKMDILGPVFEASKYYMGTPEIREMFARLLAASVNSEYSDLIHPSFTELIKQLTSLDAINLRCFIDPLQPCASYLSTTGKSSKRFLYPLVFLRNEQVATISDKQIRENASSIYNLIRLGLLVKDFGKKLENDRMYFNLTENPFVTSLIEELHNSNSKIEIEKSLLRLTDFGSSFLRVCIS